MHTKIRAVAVLALAAVAGGGVAALTGLADAKTATTLGTDHNASLGRTIVVDARGATVYELRPETARHLLCTSQGCLSFWPPLTVRSARTKPTAAPGVRGKLGVLKRGRRIFQVTLDGHPLYRFKFDGGVRGVASGDRIKSFGGTWHVVDATASRNTTTTSASTQTTTTTTTGPYGY